jgi:hypothetical protein
MPNTTKAITFSTLSAGLLIMSGGLQSLDAIYQYHVTSTSLYGRTVGEQGTDLSYTPSGLTLPVANRNSGNTAVVSVISLFGNIPTIS